MHDIGVGNRIASVEIEVGTSRAFLGHGTLAPHDSNMGTCTRAFRSSCYSSFSISSLYVLSPHWQSRGRLSSWSTEERIETGTNTLLLSIYKQRRLCG